MTVRGCCLCVWSPSVDGAAPVKAGDVVTGLPSGIHAFLSDNANGSSDVFRYEQPDRLANLVAQRGPIEFQTLPGQHRALPIELQMIAVRANQ